NRQNKSTFFDTPSVSERKIKKQVKPTNFPTAFWQQFYRKGVRRRTLFPPEKGFPQKADR
ncbi:MAG: hypothetical protein II711_02895, partial [Clostridia bacterium]|nr:hypothetical protein [Clostridia bacterium]